MQVLNFVLHMLAACIISVSPKPALDLDGTNFNSSLDAVETSARIVNGFDVDISEIPYQAALRKKSGSSWVHTCGAVVIHKLAVLTAAHCSASYVSSPSSLRIAVGTSYRLSGGKTYDISDVILHEEYSATTLLNDISMLVTASQISFGQSVQTVPFAPPSLPMPAGTEAIVSGYGTTSYEGTPSLSLQAAVVNIVSEEECIKAYLKIATVKSSMICASATDPLRDACQGDSGGPLVANGHLIGLVSWGEGCADKNYPGVYTKVSEYYSWISSNLDSIS